MDSVSLKTEPSSPDKLSGLSNGFSEGVSNGHKIEDTETKSEGGHHVKPEPEVPSDSDTKERHKKKHKDKKEKKKHKHKDKDTEKEKHHRSKEEKKAKKDKQHKEKKRKAEDSDFEVEAEISKSSSKKVKQEPTSSPQVKKRKSGGQASTTTTSSPLKKIKKEEPDWKWWEEEPLPEGQKWRTLEHKGVVLAPLYEKMPDDVHFYYEGRPITLSEPAEEVATYYAKMLDHEYTKRDVFNKNFFHDWRKEMTSKERELITDLRKCDFKEMSEYFKSVSEARRNRSKEEKKEEKLKNDALVEEYGYAIVDGHRQRLGNFRMEPPGLFRGRGNHPKMGMYKKRARFEDVTINCSKGFKVPCPDGHKWKEVRHDQSVTWLASWTENVQGAFKYVMLAATSRVKGEKDWSKYEKARHLHTVIDRIRENYTQDFKAKEMLIRQRSVALYFIDKLALRAGNEKDSDETADTVGCCSLRVEHITLHDKVEEKENVIEFDFLGKDSIRYHNFVQVDKRVYKNVRLFLDNKDKGDDLFDRLNTSYLNKYLTDLMDGLTAKVFRTYNASKTLQEQLDKMTQMSDSVPNKVLSYNRANRAVAVLCNHQRSVPKSHEKSMENLSNKLDEKKKVYLEAKAEYKQSKETFKNTKLKKDKEAMEKKKVALGRVEEQVSRLNVQITDKDENKEIALGTSKLNYLDPRITVAWCKKVAVPIEKCFNRTQREKFAWAIAMADETYSFTDVSNLTNLSQLNKQSAGDDDDQDLNNSQNEEMEEEEEEEEDE